MTKLSTPIIVDKLPVSINLNDSIMVLGSCFADGIGQRLAAGGFNVCLNPFGTLYNPESIMNSVGRLSTGKEFTEEDCVQMGAGSNLICSFSHHTSFARQSAAEFLSAANTALKEASAFWAKCNKVIVTLGTSWVWETAGSGTVVSNCLKRPAAEFTHRMLSIGEIEESIRNIIGSAPEKRFIFTVSPIRHLSLGAHANQLSKARLLTALDTVLSDSSDTAYFPAYEILLDELRDYRFYADDLVHPSNLAVELIWEKFLSAATDGQTAAQVGINEKAARRLAHRPIHQ